MLSGYSEPASWNKLAVAPIWLKDTVLDLINREAENARAGKPAHIIAKMNSLCDPKVMAALYEASAAGVKIELIVRGICCLRAGVPGLSENITVRSIVGNFLEHARILYCYNDGFEDIYMGSADWMPRNLDKRVEIMFPVEDPQAKAQAKHIFCSRMEPMRNRICVEKQRSVRRMYSAKKLSQRQRKNRSPERKNGPSNQLQQI